LATKKKREGEAPADLEQHDPPSPSKNAFTGKVGRRPIRTSPPKDQRGKIEGVGLWTITWG